MPYVLAIDDPPTERGAQIKEKALLDAEELREVGPAPDKDKVELDLEDAPFLDEEEETEADKEPKPPLDLGGGAPQKKGLAALLKNKKLLIGGGLGLLLLVTALIFLMRPSAKEEAPPPPTPPPVEAQPEPAKPPEPEAIVVSWDPFWIEHTDTNGTVRFLVCKFSASTISEKLAWEIKHKQLVLRDAIYYFLRNKDLTFLSDKTNVEVLKKDLLSVINQYLANGQLDDLLIEEYLVK